MREFLGSPHEMLSDGEPQPIEFPATAQEEEEICRDDKDFYDITRQAARQLAQLHSDELDPAEDAVRRANQTTLVMAGVAVAGLLWWQREWIEEKVLRLIGRML